MPESRVTSNGAVAVAGLVAIAACACVLGVVAIGAAVVVGVAVVVVVGAVDVLVDALVAGGRTVTTWCVAFDPAAEPDELAPPLTAMTTTLPPISAAKVIALAVRVRTRAIVRTNAERGPRRWWRRELRRARVGRERGAYQ
jgi:hypothetical protein